MTETVAMVKTTPTTRAIAQPMLFFMDRTEDRAAWRLFLDEHPRTRVIDRFEESLRELLAVKLPSLESGSPAFEMQFKVFRAQYALSRGPDELGVWVYYPWRGEAVHLLPAEEYFAVRTGRNRNVITPDDQQKFRAATVGIAGLSVGGSVALALALAGGCEQMVLSDHDGLEVSNLNRLPQSTTGLGVNKAVLAARQIYEINPYAKVLVLSDGLNRTNVDAFMTGPPRLDVIIDEMDDLAMKWDLREAARKNRIPVLMTTCVGEKILLDVERYDRNPERQFFQRTVSPDWRARVGKKLSRTEWIEAVSEIVGADEVPEAVRATNAAIGREVTTRPLLGTTVAAAGPLVANAVRALVTGAPLADGRYRMDLGAVLTPTTAPTPQPTSYKLQATPLLPATSYKLPASKKTPSWNIERWERALETKPAAYWERLGERQALKTFQLAAARVPAYQDFLKKHGVDASKIHTIDDFKSGVPIMDKENYLRAYPLASLCVDGALHKSPMISVSSGSSGKPFFWPRGEGLETEGTMIHGFMLRQGFKLKPVRTLAVVCFSMGNWVAGTYTLRCLQKVAADGFPMNIVTPGTDMNDVLGVVEHMNGDYEQLVIAGYAPFVKDVIDEGLARGIRWEEYDLRLLVAGEGISERWRTFIAGRAGIVDPTRGLASIYGTADAAILGHETPATITLRRHWADHADETRALFNDERLPMLFEYHPYFKYFETIGSELIFTARAGVPLVRYNIHDEGGILSTDGTTGLPRVYLYGRRNLGCNIYSVNIYWENLRGALEEPEISHLVTGKFSSQVVEDRELNPVWKLFIETPKNVVPTDLAADQIKRTIVQSLIQSNSEYRRQHAASGKKVEPLIFLSEHGDPMFKIGAKLNWKTRE